MKLKYNQLCVALSMSMLLSLGLTACSDSKPAEPAATPAAPAASTPATSTPAAEAPAPAASTPAAASGDTAAAPAGECSVELTGDDAMKYSLNEITVPASCADFTINFKHTGKMPKTAMGHNVVVTKTADVNAVVKDGMKAGASTDYIKAGDERVLAHTKLLGGGESESLKLDVAKLKADPYSFICTFPGHSGTMHGTIVVK